MHILKMNYKKIFHDTNGYVILLQRKNFTTSYIQYYLFLFIYMFVSRTFLLLNISVVLFSGRWELLKPALLR